MLLTKIAKACSKLEDYREDMNSFAMDKGLQNSEVLKVSQRLD